MRWRMDGRAFFFMKISKTPQATWHDPGIGTDLCNIDASAACWRHGDRFRNRVFTPTELARPPAAGTGRDIGQTLAAKEAC